MSSFEPLHICIAGTTLFFPGRCDLSLKLGLLHFDLSFASCDHVMKLLYFRLDFGTYSLILFAFDLELGSSNLPICWPTTKRVT